MIGLTRDVERFDTKVRRADSGCWEWTASTRGDGYGAFRYRGKMVYAHRFSYEIHVGPIPLGLELDHLCRNRRCVNPAHLEPVTKQVNVARGEPANRTHCVHGHAYSEKNTYREPTTGRRHCQSCMRAHNAKRVACNDCGISVQANHLNRHLMTKRHRLALLKGEQ